MYCAKCGKEVNPDWKMCPHCGAPIQQVEDTNNVESGLEPEMVPESAPEVLMQQEDKLDFSIGHPKITGRLILKLLALIAMVCFFCPLYMVSCGKQELFTLSGMDMTLGFEYMGETLDGYISFGALLLLPFISLCAVFISRSKLKAHEKLEILRYANYINAVCSIATLLVMLYFTIAMQDAAQESGVNVRTEPALIIMALANVIALLIGTYLAYLAEPRVKKGKTQSKSGIWIKTILKILGAGIVITVLVMTPMAKDMRPSTNPDNQVKETAQAKEKEDSKEKDLTDVDLDKVVGKSAKDIKKLGFKKHKEDGKYYNGDICIGLDDADTVNYILIEGDVDKAPSFRKVELGMNTDTVKNLLQDAYDQEEQMDDSYTVRSYDAKEKIVFAEEEGKVTSICYSTLSDEEVADLKAKAEGNYIFPDSDKKYLSEDEVRSKSADELLKGRNEIYARHGRMFDMPELADYFAQQPWYEGTIPADQFDESVLNDYEKKNVQLIKQIEDEVNGTASSSAGNFNTGACSDLMASWAEGVIPEQGSYVYITGRVTGHSGGTIFLQPYQVVPDMLVYYDSSQYTPADGTEITVCGIMGVEVVDGQYSMDGYVFIN